ncbi:MAG: DUF551 domain-containing protein, partial [Caldilineaceae bacterium]
MTTATITWIPVAERLPDDGITVLIALSDGDVLSAWLDGDTQWWVEYYGSIVGEVTHWADLPAAPHEAEAQPAQAVPLTDEAELPESYYREDDGCPTEGAVLRREWRAMRAEIDSLKAQPAQAVPAGWMLVPDWKGYARLGTGNYVINSSRAPADPEL